ncbi:MAG: hypothetical protein J5I65_12445 [Aridibacter famidurans]|nr:hypothetical protein [Aridibacter famidurans]
MTEELKQKEKVLYNRCDEVLHYLWDPIGVSDIVQARDEYHSYLPTVFAMVRDEKRLEEIADYLTGIESRWMGLTPSRDGAKKVAEVLLDWRDEILGSSEEC